MGRKVPFEELMTSPGGLHGNVYDKPTFARLTGTIVRQVGDLRRIVDEFSSFARMPKPVFRREALGDIAGLTLVLSDLLGTDSHSPAPVA